MAVNRGLGVRQNGNIGTTAKEMRLALAGLLAENSLGVPRSGLLDPVASAVVTGSGGWTYNVLPCNPVKNRAAGEGVYMWSFSDASTVPTSVAPGTGFRYDLIWTKQNDLDKGDPDNLAYVGVTEGLAASSPAKPYGSVPEGALVLAEALVGAGATGTNHVSVTITQVFPFTTTRGAVLPVRDATERDAITAQNGQRVRRLDLGDTIETRRNGAWMATTPTLIPSGNMKVGWAIPTGAGVSAASAPRIWSPDGVTAHLAGLVRYTGGGAGDVLSVPAAYAPVDGSLRPVGTVLTSLNGTDSVNGVVIALFMEGGVIKVTYQSKTLAVGALVPLHCTWPIR
jgi:hypothetical protein